MRNVVVRQLHPHDCLCLMHLEGQSLQTGSHKKGRCSVVHLTAGPLHDAAQREERGQLCRKERSALPSLADSNQNHTLQLTERKSHHAVVTGQQKR